MRIALATLILLATPAVAEAKLHREAVAYNQGGQALEGYLVYDEAQAGKRPGVMVVHEWWGLNAYVKRRADQLAGLGYVAFAADMYGKGKVATTRDQAKQYASALYGDNALWRARAKAGWEQLVKRPQVDPARLAAMGYCFGGGTALELARTGTPMAGVVTFHGSLGTPHPEASQIKGKVLVLHGADDANLKDLPAFQAEMRQHHTNYQLNLYGGAVHAFSNPEAGNDPSKGAAYDAQADKRSWDAMGAFFREVFGQ
ncbi:MAG: dienelactone hydrolase [Cyanobacteria bacterium RYN_339]|nr:dienelactone hydrolase [Cyanobacteria bacterium RYN_339]